MSDASVRKGSLGRFGRAKAEIKSEHVWFWSCRLVRKSAVYLSVILKFEDVYISLFQILSDSGIVDPKNLEIKSNLEK